MPHYTPNQQKNNWMIAVCLLLLVCFLAGAELFSQRTTPNENTKVNATESIPAPTPSPTPFPTKEPAVISIPEIPEDPYPELYGDNPNQEFAPPEENVVYLTFDDGPSNSTPALLEVLKEEGVPATFFIMEDDFPELLKQIYEDGHTLGVHTHSHDYSYVYWTKEAFLADFCRSYCNIWDATGYRPRIFRFPGGSVNSYNRHLVWDLVTEMERRGFVYYDWNVTSEDASSAKIYEDQINALITYSQYKPRIIALLHDTDKNPWIAQVVKDYIHYMRERGYQFKALDSSVKPIHFPLP